MDNLTEEVASPSAPSPQHSAAFDQQLTSPLFSILPGELRNEIIRLAVVEPSDITPEITHSIDVLTGKSTAKLDIEHPLMQTCKRLRQESAEIYFLENTFRLTDQFFSGPPVVTWPDNKSSQQPRHKANERAIKVLAQAFGPWASKVRKLGLSRVISYDLATYGNYMRRLRRAQVQLSIWRDAQTDQGTVHLEDLEAHDVARVSSFKLCCCSISQHAAEHSSGADIFEVARGLVCMLDLATGPHSLPYCWTCGLEPMY